MKEYANIKIANIRKHKRKIEAKLLESSQIKLMERERAVRKKNPRIKIKEVNGKERKKAGLGKLKATYWLFP